MKWSSLAKYSNAILENPVTAIEKYHNFPADLCVMVVLRRLSYPCTFQELVDIFGFPPNRIADMYHIAIDYN
jgi:hypothetical protein